jgi:kinesin family protein 11
MASASQAHSNGASSYENVQVVVRMRPMNSSERKASQPAAVTCVGSSQITLDMPVVTAAVPKRKEWAFDRVYDEQATQEHLFETAVAPVVDEVLRGYSCTVFAYGQTGTGKTHTMEGARGADGLVDAESPEAGIIPRSVKRVFDSLQARFPDVGLGEYAVKMSFLEIYNEKVRRAKAAAPTDNPPHRLPPAPRSWTTSCRQSPPPSSTVTSRAASLALRWAVRDRRLGP